MSEKINKKRIELNQKIENESTSHFSVHKEEEEEEGEQEEEKEGECE